MNNKQKVVFDVTHLIGWKGNLTGIPRTTDEIARRLKGVDGVRFVSWDTDRQDFSSVDIDYYYNEIDPFNRDFYKQKNNEVDTLNEVSMQGITLLKDRLRRKFPKAVKKAVEVKAVVRKAGKKTTDTIKRNPVFSGKYEPLAGEVFFIPCGTWDDEAYINRVLEYKSKGCKLAFISYDLLPIVVPQFSGQWGGPMKDFTRRVTSKCDVVFSISEHTKKDLNYWLKENNLAQPRISVIHLGDSFSETKPEMPVHKEFVRSKIKSSKEEFILCTGTVEARKNHTLLYYVYKLAKSRGVKLPKLVIAGRHGHRTENIVGIIKDDPEINNDIFLLDDVNDNELSWLYKNCSFTVYPSFYEGWGLPIAESIVKGVPCICSNTSSMPEVAPGIPEYFNPCSVEECLDKIINYCDPKILSEARKKTKKYKQTSWDYTFNQVVNELELLGEVNS